jgi:hypothetical protein
MMSDRGGSGNLAVPDRMLLISSGLERRSVQPPTASAG